MFVIYSGGSYVLSKKALKILVEEVWPKDENCGEPDDGVEDYKMGA